MADFTDRFMVLLIDLDGRYDRIEEAKSEIPDELTDRVFIIGTLTEPERLKVSIGLSYEKIGEGLARDCAEGTDSIWNHELLRHNAAELVRMRVQVRPILFQ